MDFQNSVFSLYPPRRAKISLIGATLPSDKDIFFRAKQKETLDRYQAARRFMYETENSDLNHYFNPLEDEQANLYFQNVYRSQFYEAALLFYNTVIDLSWIACYVSLEYVAYVSGKIVETEKITSIEDAYNALRSQEKLVEHPRTENTPFQYLKSVCPEYTDVIDFIIEFWDSFAQSSVRTNYNFLKHKGALYYEEIQKNEPCRLFSFQVNDQLCPSDIRDVQKAISLEGAISQLVDFDNNVLYPYIKTLFEKLERLVKPSPFIF